MRNLLLPSDGSFPNIFSQFGMGKSADDLKSQLLDFTMTDSNLPVPYVASASSEYPGYFAFKAFDKNINTGWSSSGDPLPQWVKVDLGQIYLIGSIHVQANVLEYGQCLKNGTALLSPDDIAYSTVYTFLNEPAWSAGEERIYNISAIPGRYLKINITESYYPGYIVLGNIYIYILV